MPSVQNVYCSSPTRCPDWSLAHYSPRGEWVPSGNNGEIKAARNELATIPYMPMAQDKCLLYQALPYVRKYTGLPLSLHLPDVMWSLEVTINHPIHYRLNQATFSVNFLISQGSYTAYLMSWNRQKILLHSKIWSLMGWHYVKLHRQPFLC